MHSTLFTLLFVTAFSCFAFTQNQARDENSPSRS